MTTRSRVNKHRAINHIIGKNTARTVYIENNINSKSNFVVICVLTVISVKLSLHSSFTHIGVELKASLTRFELGKENHTVWQMFGVQLPPLRKALAVFGQTPHQELYQLHQNVL